MKEYVWISKLFCTRIIWCFNTFFNPFTLSPSGAGAVRMLTGGVRENTLQCMAHRADQCGSEEPWMGRRQCMCEDSAFEYVQKGFGIYPLKNRPVQASYGLFPLSSQEGMVGVRLKKRVSIWSWETDSISWMSERANCECEWICKWMTMLMKSIEWIYSTQQSFLEMWLCPNFGEIRLNQPIPLCLSVGKTVLYKKLVHLC